MLMQAYNAVGSNTPGAASSAADLEAQDPPKSRPKPKKFDVEKQHIFSIDFLKVRTSFWKAFWMAFGSILGGFGENLDASWENLGIQNPPRCLQRQAC